MDSTSSRLFENELVLGIWRQACTTGLKFVNPTQTLFFRNKRKFLNCKQLSHETITFNFDTRTNTNEHKTP